MRCPRCGSEMGFKIESVLDMSNRVFFIDYLFRCPKCFTKRRVDRVFVEKRDGCIVLVRGRGWA